MCNISVMLHHTKSKWILFSGKQVIYIYSQLTFACHALIDYQWRLYMDLILNKQQWSYCCMMYTWQSESVET